MTPSVVHDAHRNRYEIRVDGQEAGFMAYESDGRALAVMHTEIDPRFAGRGLASRLVGAALDDVRRRGLGVVPVCPYVRAYIARHAEYLDLVPEDERDAFGLAGAR